MLQTSGNKRLMRSGNVYSEVENKSNQRGTDALDGRGGLYCMLSMECR